MNRFFLSEQRLIAAPRETLFNIVADPKRHSEIDGSGTVKGELVSSHERLELGSKFGMKMRKGINYRMTNTVVEFEEGARIAWKPAGNYIWRYTFEDVPGGTLVTEQWDARKFKMRHLLALIGVPKSTKRALEATLGRLTDLTENQPAS